MELIIEKIFKIVAFHHSSSVSLKYCQVAVLCRIQVLLFPALCGRGDGNLLWWKVGFLCNPQLPGTAVWWENAHSSTRF